jgi:ATP-dependent Lon protease
MRAGIKTVFIPKDNEKDLADIPDSVKKGLEINPVSHVDEVIMRALARKPEAITWEEPVEAPPQAPEASATGAALPH